MLEDDYFGDMCNAYPELQPLRQCRKSLSNLSRFETVLGEDGFNRSTLWMFGTVTSRNNPKAKDFLLSRPHWVRNLIAPREGMALVACDVTVAEDWLAAGFSGDPELMRIYSSGADSYMEFAAVTEAVPFGTMRDKKNKELEIIRAQHKTAKLAIQYGVGGETLSKYLGVPLSRRRTRLRGNGFRVASVDRTHECQQRPELPPAGGMCGTASLRLHPVSRCWMGLRTRCPSS